MIDTGNDRPTRLLLVGYGRMGRLVDALSGECQCEVVARLDGRAVRQGGLRRERLPTVDVVVDFSTADAFIENVSGLVSLGTALVVGTTGWHTHAPEVRRLAEDAGIGVVAAANFSPGVVLFEALVERAAALWASQSAYGAWIHEAHHEAKRDAPSGTALSLHAAMVRAGLDRPVDLSSTRAGSIPGIHTVGFDGPSDTITMTHTARDRHGFARGALVAAHWVRERRGWFSMRDVLGLGGDMAREPLS